MWVKSHQVITKKIKKEQIWKLMADINNWGEWNADIEFAKLEGRFEKGNFFTLRPNGGPTVKIELIEVKENERFTDLTRFPFAKMYGDHQYEETEDGLKITVTMSVTGLLAFLWIKLVASKIVKELPADIQNQIERASKL
jgi:hypothetical protein